LLEEIQYVLALVSMDTRITILSNYMECVESMWGMLVWWWCTRNIWG